MFQIGDIIYKRDFNNEIDYNHKCLEFQSFANTTEDCEIEQTQDYTKIIKTEVSLEDKNKSKLFELQDFLNDSDYIGRKISEIIALDQNLENFLNEYSDKFQMTNREILIKSQEARVRLNELKQYI